MNLVLARKHAKFARWGLYFLVASAVVVAHFTRWTSSWSMDNRTFVEMVDGVRRHGLPYTLNGPHEEFAELHAPFNVSHGGRLWGVYPPLHAYLAAPALALGGVAYLFKFNVWVLCFVAIATFFLAKELSRSPLAAIGASYAVAFGSPVVMGSYMTHAQPLNVLMGTLAVYTGVLSVRKRRRALAFAFGCGFLMGFATLAHLSSMATAATMFGAFLYVGGPIRASETIRDRLSSLLPTKIMWGRFALGTAGFALALIPLAFLNHERFQTWNPISYGPCEWFHCTYTVGQGLNTAALMRFVKPTLPWFLAVVAALVLLPPKRKTYVSVAIVAVLAILLLGTWTGNLKRMIEVMFGYLFDLTHVPMAPFPGAEDGLGFYGGGRVVKSLFQCSPILMLGLCLPLGRTGSRAAAAFALSAPFGLFLGLGLLGRFEGAHALGWPYLFPRYVVPAIPILAALCAARVAHLKLGPRDFVFAIAGSAVGLFVLLRTTNDTALWLRILELRVTLLVGVLACAFVILHDRYVEGPVRRWARYMTVSAFVLSIWVSIGVDSNSGVRLCQELEDVMDYVRANTPNRFALAGWTVEGNHVLSLRAERDIEYIDLGEVKTWDGFRILMDRWAKANRPIFGVFPEEGFTWPYSAWDVTARKVGVPVGHTQLWAIDPPKMRALPNGGRLPPELDSP